MVNYASSAIFDSTDYYIRKSLLKLLLSFLSVLVLTLFNGMHFGYNNILHPFLILQYHRDLICERCWWGCASVGYLREGRPSVGYLRRDVQD